MQGARIMRRKAEAMAKSCMGCVLFRGCRRGEVTGRRGWLAGCGGPGVCCCVGAGLRGRGGEAALRRGGEEAGGEDDGGEDGGDEEVGHGVPFSLRRPLWWVGLAAHMSTIARKERGEYCPLAWGGRSLGGGAREVWGRRDDTEVAGGGARCALTASSSVRCVSPCRDLDRGGDRCGLFVLLEKQIPSLRRGRQTWGPWDGKHQRETHVSNTRHGRLCAFRYSGLVNFPV